VQDSDIVRNICTVLLYTSSTMTSEFGIYRFSLFGAQRNLTYIGFDTLQKIQQNFYNIK
jgi:hypothetical protein